MSKKILKRSLALGALMAFVITGSAYAETVKYTDNVSYTDGLEISSSAAFDVNLDKYKLTVENSDGKGISTWCASVKIKGETGSVVEVDAATYGLFAHSYGKSIEIDADSVIIKSGTNNTVHAQSPITISGNIIKLSKTTNSSSNIIQTENSPNANIKITGGELTVDGSNAGRTIRVAYGNRVDIDVNKIILTDSDNNGDITEDIKVSGTGSALTIKANEGSINANIYSADSSGVGSINLELGKDVTLISTVITDAGATNELTLNGATWNMTGASSLTNATFTAGSELVIDGETFKYVKGGENVYALNGVGDKATLTVENGAKLKINGITETTYNIAQGFTNLEDAVDKWEVSDINALMQGVAWTTKDGLQVEVFAKEAEQMATEMGVSNSTAQSLANVTAAAQQVGGTGDKNGTGDAKAVALVNAIANAAPEAAGQAFEAVSKMAEAGGNSGTAASIVKNVTGVTNDRLSFNCGHSAPHKGGHGVGLFEEGSGADVWVEYVHGKDKVEDMPSSAGATSYEGQYNGIVMGVDFKKVNKFQSGFAFNYGEGDTNSVGSAARTHSDYDFWGIGYYGSIHNDDSNVIFDIGYAKTDSDVETKALGMTYNASPETTTWTAGVKVEKLYQNENVQIVPYTGLRFMSIDPEDYSTKCASSKYQMERQNVWLLPLGVSIKQEVTNDNGWTVSPRVDLSYIWAFGDTDSEMEFSTLGTKTNIGYEVMDDGSFLGLVGIEAHKGQWGFGVSYSYQKGDHSTSKKWFIDANYSF